MKTPETAERRAQLLSVIDHAAHYLPAQGPIGVFIHHNTLHAFQHLPFEEAVAQASRMFGTEPYMTEQQFRAAVAAGRIEESDIDAVLAGEPDADVLTGRLRRRALRKLMLLPGIRLFQPETIRWELEEGLLLETETARTLFYACLDRADLKELPEQTVSDRPRDILLESTGVDLDDVIHPLLIRLCGAYLDQGMAYWPMPEREEGFYIAVRSLYSRPGAVPPEHLAGLSAEFIRQEREGYSGDQAVMAALDRLGIRPPDWEQFLIGELLALPGWAGLMRRLEEEPGLAPHECLPCSLTDFLAVRLTMTAIGVASLKRLTDSAPPSTFSVDTKALRLCAAAQLFDVARLAGLQPADVVRMTESEVAALQSEIRLFDDLERRRIFHLAFELWHQRGILGPMARYRQMNGIPTRQDRSFAQVFCCLDEREESFRRQLEEIAPNYETFGAAGFYGIAVDYAGIDDAHGAPLCPVVMKPQHAVLERPVAEHRDLHRRRKALRSLWARVKHNLSISSRTLVRGALSTAVLGVFSLFPLAAHVLSPRRYSKFVEALNKWILPEPRTELTLMRSDETGHVAAEKLLLGFSIEEKADRVASVLAPAGLTSNFAPIVVVLGHGSTSLNNPHESAHDCGACGGRRGGPNGRLFAAMANHPGVRALLKERGISIPEDTWFVGGYHDTCSDEIEYFDLEQIPASLKAHYASVRSTLHEARQLNAHERARRFEAAADNLNSSDALWHVQERSEHLAEPRPEYGHCTNAICIVGRRELTRGLFFDRRAFLVSYQPVGDDSGENLGKLLAAAIPVCAGISLEYYFSYVDNEGYGCGTKLPHNVTGLMAIMNGAASDLRTGLPWQMVEIHEPVRILFVIESTPEILQGVISRSPVLTEFVVNRWIRLATMDPQTGAVHIYRDGVYEPQPDIASELPVAPTSRHWYQGTLEHLPVARIGEVQTV